MPVQAQRYNSITFATLMPEKGVWLAPHPVHCTPRKDLVPIVQEAWWASGPVWMGMENLAPIGNQSLDLPALQKSL